jgi:hypothetical protein
MDCFVARAPRNDGEYGDPFFPRHCERSEAIHDAANAYVERWIASSQELLAMTENTEIRFFRVIASEAKQSMMQQTRMWKDGLLRPKCFSQ